MPDERFNTGHFYPLQGRQSIVVSAPRRGLGDDHLGAISMQSDSAMLDLITQPSNMVENMFGEALSVLAIPNQDIFVVTHPIPGMVTFWGLSSGKMHKMLKLPKARGLAITSDRRGIWISYGPQVELIRIDFVDLKIVKRINNSYLTGSHLYKL